MLNSNKNAIKLLKMPKKITECIIKENDICSNKEIINKLIEFYKKIIEKNKKVASSQNIKNIMIGLYKILGCSSESCVIVHPQFKNFVKNNGLILNNLKENFMPDGPSHSKEWLSNKNIDEVLEIYKKMLNLNASNFLHINCQLRDFEKYNTGLSKINWYQKINSGIKFFCVVINTDYTGGSGIHWFCIFGDFKKKNNYTLEYFNSSGDPPLPEINKWLYKIKNIISKKMSTFINVVYVNKFNHQTDNSSCGVYCLYYIWCRINNIPYEYFQKFRVPDELMYEFRKYLFRWHK